LSLYPFAHLTASGGAEINDGKPFLERKPRAAAKGRGDKGAVATAVLPWVGGGSRPHNNYVMITVSPGRFAVAVSLPGVS
jgi:hypothetical protein